MDKGKRKIREGETSQWIREKGEKERHHNGIREGETSQWIVEKVQSEKERHHNG